MGVVSGWPRLNWFVTENLSKSPKDWQPPPRISEDVPAYIEVCTMLCFSPSHIVRVEKKLRDIEVTDFLSCGSWQIGKKGQSFLGIGRSG